MKLKDKLKELQSKIRVAKTFVKIMVDNYKGSELTKRSKFDFPQNRDVNYITKVLESGKIKITLEHTSDDLPSFSFYIPGVDDSKTEWLASMRDYLTSAFPVTGRSLANLMITQIKDLEPRQVMPWIWYFLYRVDQQLDLNINYQYPHLNTKLSQGKDKWNTFQSMKSRSQSSN